MTVGKYNENDNENCSPGESFRDDPFRGCGEPGSIDAGVCSAERPALIDVGDAKLEWIVLKVPGGEIPPGTANVIVK